MTPEHVEELYGMVWYLANKYHQAMEDWNAQDWHTGAGFTVAEAVEEARKNYTEGLKLSRDHDKEEGLNGAPN